VLALDPVLIANRGEIAVRVARTVHGLGLRSAGVYTAADAASPHLAAVDAGARIESYLDAGELLRAAALAGARSVHPGYGFLSENAAFARAVAAAGLIWIGPPPEAIELMADKGAAKQAAEQAGVPVVPSGDQGGYPVIVKAVAGGGGKGMRIARTECELAEAKAAAAREAQAAFGDDRVIVERYLERPHHIEVQVLADDHGAVVHLGERECSLQRRHQKVVEEAPSPAVGQQRRTRMGEAAVALTRACDYRGAGTVEFIAPADGSDFFFLEMNTRLQVEHPVTELVYGIDLVEAQLRIAAGEHLGFEQDDLRPYGHAIEARIYAEDPAAGFLPATGTVLAYREPHAPGVRVDSGVCEGTPVGTSFDPLLAKVIAHGPDRERALARLHRALGELELLGVATNAAFTRMLLERDDVRAGEQDTGLLERVLDRLALDPPDDLLPAAALAAAGTAHPAGPWRRALQQGDVRVAGGTVSLGDRTWSAEVLDATDGLTAEIDGVTRRYAVASAGYDVWVGRDGHQLAAVARRAVRSAAAALVGSLEAPMPGTVVLVNVADGDRVSEGDVLIVLESMKMELAVAAPHDGIVEGLELSPGDRVALKQPLVAVTAPTEQEDAG
jgi:acetyl-CoA/propionyl-CoA carboxylase biotin carboxyl carrier protein